MAYSDYELVYMVKENEEALNIMIKKYEPLFRKLAFSFAKKYKYKNIDVEDIVQQCRITMCYIIERYDESNEVLFYSFLIICLRRYIRSYLRKIINGPNFYSFEEGYLLSESLIDINDINDVFIDDEFCLKIKEFSYKLKFLDSCIFELRLNNFSYKEIATLLDITVKKVDNTLLKIRKKLEKSLFDCS